MKLSPILISLCQSSFSFQVRLEVILEDLTIEFVVNALHLSWQNAEIEVNALDDF